MKHQKNYAFKYLVFAVSALVLGACAPTQQNNASTLPTFLPGMQRTTPAQNNNTPSFPPSPAPASRSAAPPSMMNQAGHATNSPFGLPNANTPPTQPRPPSNPLQLKQQLDQADRLYRSGHFAQAEQAYLVLLNSNPAQSIVHYRLGNIAFKKGEHKVAADHFQQAIKLAPNDAKAHYNLAVAYLSLAELHLKNYSGTLSRDADTSKITRLLREINKFAMNKSVQTTEKDALDALADALE